MKFCSTIPLVLLRNSLLKIPTLPEIEPKTAACKAVTLLLCHSSDSCGYNVEVIKIKIEEALTDEQQRLYIDYIIFIITAPLYFAFPHDIDGYVILI